MGLAFAIPTYAFIIGMVLMLVWGLFESFVLGEDLRAPSTGLELQAENDHLYGLAFAFLIARAFSSGCAALTGVEAISNGVPAFRKPKSRNAATTLLLLGTIAITLLMGIILLAERIGVVIAEEPGDNWSTRRRDTTRRRSSPSSPRRCSTTSRSGSTSSPSPPR